MSGLVSQVLLCLLFGVVVPGVGDLIPQLALSLLEVLDNFAVVGPASTTGRYGAGTSQPQLLAAVAFEDYAPWLPLVGPAKRVFFIL